MLLLFVENLPQDKKRFSSLSYYDVYAKRLLRILLILTVGVNFL